jgi:hypothetical protein
VLHGKIQTVNAQNGTPNTPVFGLQSLHRLSKQLCTMKASNFGPAHGNFGPSLATSVTLLDKLCAKKRPDPNLQI